MIYDLRNIKDADVKGKTVFLRADLDIPIQPSAINHQPSVADDSRLNAWFPTLEYLLKNQAQVYLAGHLGRPTKQFLISNFQFSKENEDFSLKPVAQWIAQKLRIQSLEFRIENKIGFNGWRLSENVFLLENLRFFKEEEENNDEFSKKLASLAQIYVNDAFASSHRKHASIVGITKFLPSYAGFRLIKEVGVLGKILEKPKRPLCIVLGGAKIETKLPLVEKMHTFADFVLVGGEIAENDKVLLKVQHEKIKGKKSALIVADLTKDKKDITFKSAQNFLQIAQICETVVWSGPLGLVEEKKNRTGTYIFSHGLSKILNFKVVGGGDTLSFLNEENLLKDFSFASIGGGAMLEFLAGIKLPGLVVLEK